MLKQRFQVLMKGLRLMEMEDCSKLIQICCALHNYLKEKGVEFEFVWPPTTTTTTTSTEEAASDEYDSDLDDTIPLPDVSDTEEDTAAPCSCCGGRIPIPIKIKEVKRRVPTNQIIMDKYF